MARQELTQKQEAFCLAYIETGGASEAYRRAFNTSAMKPETINRRAFDLMNNGKITARITSLREAVASKTVVSEARVIDELARIGLVDPARAFAADGDFLPIHEIPAEVRSAIASVKVVNSVGKDGEAVVKTEVKFWDKNSALEKIARHLGSFERDNLQRATAFDGVPRETVRTIIDRLQSLQEQR